MDERRVYMHDAYRACEVDRYASIKLQTILKWLDHSRPLRILNVGCGSGEANVWLARAGHWVDACDPDEVAVAISLALKRENGLERLAVMQKGLDDIQPDAAYDCVFMLDVLEHLADDESAIRRLHALLKPGGLGCISVPALPVLFGHHDVMLGHYRRYTRRSLHALVAPFFEPLVIRYFGLFLIPVAFVLSRLLKRPYPIASAGRAEAIRRALDLILAVESRVAFPVGTSLLFIGRRRVAPMNRLIPTRFSGSDTPDALREGRCES